MIRNLVTAVLLLPIATQASASGLPDLKLITGSVDSEYLTYSGAYGHRIVVNAQSKIDAGNTKFSALISQGTRKIGDSKYHATRFQGTLSHDWNSRLSTRTTFGIGSDAPIFVTRELSQDLSYKILSRTLVTGGAGYARYFGGADSWSWSAGVTQYFGGGYVSYRFTNYDTQGLKNSVGHLVSAKLTDPYGATTLWAGHGTSLRSPDLAFIPQRGKYTQVELQRSLPLGGGVSLTLAGRHSWNQSTTTKFHSNGLRVGLSFSK